MQQKTKAIQENNEGGTAEIKIQDQGTKKRRVYCGRSKLQVQISGIVRREKIITSSTSGSVGRSEYRSTSRRITSKYK
jgi:hypothetical protein